MTTAPSLLRPGLSPEELARAVFRAELPESAVKALPPQSVYLAIKSQGVENSAELVALLSPEQLRISLDFDLWKGDDFDEESFWTWLVATDEDESLDPIKRLVSTIDLKLLALIIGRHVKTVVFDEPTENPPGAQYYTPDRGYTWVYIGIDDGDKHRLLGKLMAFIFESSAELFYQLISIPGLSTESELIESGYQDKLRRLGDEDIPDMDTSFKINAPLRLFEARPLLEKAEKRTIIDTVQTIEPIVYLGGFPDRVSALLEELKRGADDKERDFIESELTLILNSAIQRYAVQMADYDGVKNLVAKVKGAVNIGLEIASKESQLSLLDILRVLGLTGIYRLGLTPIMEIGRAAARLPKELLESGSLTPGWLELLNATRQNFPEIPTALEADGSFAETEGRIITGSKPFTTLAETELAARIISQKLSN
jgi:hypothetical protein